MIDPFADCNELGAKLASLAADAMLPAKTRSIEQFADEEIVIPTGPMKGTRFSCKKNPFVRLWFRELEKGIWRRAVITGPQRSGKTLIGFIIPTLYHLFEVRETVICGIPDLNMVQSKWNVDIKPAIAASKFEDLMPADGPGSRGGAAAVLIIFKNGSVLIFMSGGAGDKGRAGADTRVLVITETDGMGKSGEASEETNKIRQLEGRTEAWGERAMTYMECTVTVEDGITWSEYSKGTASRIAIRCPHCAKWVTPDREHFVGWQEAKNIIEAGNLAHLVCPKCGVAWTEEDRVLANQDPKLVHRGQDIDDATGEIIGVMVPTDTLGFRWTCVNNLLIPMSLIGRREWKAKNSPDEEDSEREMCQFVWARPYQGDRTDLHKISAAALSAERSIPLRKGDLPPGTVRIGVGIDVGLYFIHWTVIAYLANGTPHVVEYDRLNVIRDKEEEKAAIKTALRRLRDEVINLGWSGMKSSINCVDAGNWQDTVCEFCKESGAHWIPVKGFGDEQFGKLGKDKRQTGAKVILGAADGAKDYEVVIQVDGNMLLEANADRWKSTLHADLAIPMGKPLAMSFFYFHDGHGRFCQHLCAEKGVEEYEAGKGTVVRWVKIRKENHWLDSTTEALIAGHVAELLWRIRGPEKPKASALPPQMQTDGGMAEPPPAAHPSKNFATGGGKFKI